MARRLALVGARKRADELLLLASLDRLDAVVGADPGHWVPRWLAGERREAGERRTGPSVPAQAAELDDLAGPSPRQQILQGSDERPRVGWHSEVRPRHVCVRPWRHPLSVEVQPEINGRRPCIRVVSVERHCRDRGAFWQLNEITVDMHLEALVLMVLLFPTERLLVGILVLR